MVSANHDVGMRANPGRHLVGIWSIPHNIAKADNGLKAPGGGIMPHGIQGFPVGVNITQHQKAHMDSHVISVCRAQA